jgi:sugar phosphate isomerase/epimerase
MLPLGAATYKYLWTDSLDGALERIAALGLRCVEVMTAPPHAWVADMDRAACRSLRAACASRKLRLCALNPTFLDLNIASPNPGIRRESVRQIVQTARICHEVGAPVLILSGGRVHPLIAPPFDVSLGFVHESLREVVEACERLDVTIGFENGWNLIDRSEQLVVLVRAVESRHLKIAYDVANANVVEDALKGLERVAPYLVHLHLSDSRPGVRAHDPIGTGTIDYAAIASALRAMNYRGVSVMEILDRSASDSAVLQSIRTLAAYGWAP